MRLGMHDWHAEDIKAAVRKRGTTLAELARTAGLSKQVLSSCLQGRASENGDRVIADFLGLKPHEIWPSRYAKNGKRVRFCAPKNGKRKAA